MSKINLVCVSTIIENLKCIKIACGSNSSFAVTDRGKVHMLHALATFLVTWTLHVFIVGVQLGLQFQW